MGKRHGLKPLPAPLYHEAIRSRLVTTTVWISPRACCYVLLLLKNKSHAVKTINIYPLSLIANTLSPVPPFPVAVSVEDITNSTSPRLTTHHSAVDE